MIINWKDFEPVPHQSRREQLLYIKVTKDGSFMINSNLLRAIESSGYELHVAKDGRQLAIRTGEEIDIKLPKTGIVKNYDVVSKLHSKKIKMPVYYVGDKDEDGNWLGELTYNNPRKPKEFQTNL